MSWHRTIGNSRGSLLAIPRVFETEKLHNILVQTNQLMLHQGPIFS